MKKHNLFYIFLLFICLLIPNEINSVQLSFTLLDGGCTDSNACNYNDSAAFDDGSCLYACDENQGEITTLVTCDGGTWQYEVSWQIYDENSVLIASGGAPYSNEICLQEDECYTIEMQDSYGDGWNNSEGRKNSQK